MVIALMLGLKDGIKQCGNGRVLRSPEAEKSGSNFWLQIPYEVPVLESLESST